jgi:alpha-beta hydrolase superfamily lysophospholipase
MKAKRLEADVASCSAQADAFAAGVPTARVVRLANADHYIFNSNQAEVMREMNEFLAKLH